jgi:hypothetical protein
MISLHQTPAPTEKMMPDLLIENVPDEVCCAYRSMSDEERRLVAFELAASVRRITCKRPHLEDVDRYIERIREFREKGTLKPITDELIEEAITGRCLPEMTDMPDELRREFQQLPAEERRKLAAQVLSSLQDVLLERRTRNGPSKLERVRAFLEEYEGEPLDPALVEEALNMRHA